MSSREADHIRLDQIDISTGHAKSARLTDRSKQGSTEEEDEWEGLSEEEIEQWLSGTTAPGSTIDEEDIDEILYGSMDEFESDLSE